MIVYFFNMELVTLNLKLEIWGSFLSSPSIKTTNLHKMSIREGVASYINNFCISQIGNVGVTPIISRLNQSILKYCRRYCYCQFCVFFFRWHFFGPKVGTKGQNQSDVALPVSIEKFCDAFFFRHIKKKPRK